MTQLLAVASALGERISERLKEPVHRVDLPARESGDVPRVALGVMRDDVLRVAAMVSGLGSSSSIAWIGERDGVASLIGAHAHPGDALPALGDRIAACIAEGALDRVLVNALDAGVGLVQGFSHTLTVPGSWFGLAIYGEWTESAGASGTCVEIGGTEHWARFAWIVQDPSGVTVSLPACEIGGARTKWELSTPAELRAAFRAIALHAKRAIDGRAVWRARAFPLHVAGQRIIESIAAAGVVRGTLQLSVGGGAGFPERHPSGCVFRKDEIGHHVCVNLEESADGVAIAAGRSSFVAKSTAELDALLPALAKATAEEHGRLTPDKLVPGALYRVQRDLPGAPRGTLLRFDRRQHVAYDGFDIHHFTAVEEERAVALYAIDPAVTAALPRLDEFLEAVPEGPSGTS